MRHLPYPTNRTRSSESYMRYCQVNCDLTCPLDGTEKSVVPDAEDGEYRTASTMTVTLSSDHRTVDGAVSALFLKAFKGYMENPLKMLL
ncbi:hypothetical protein BGX30_011513 [Mortierella sp. GBA39]|nr:hypothetical protein BGX30_011513 [Mortierella sp. GBA39]